MIAGSGGTRTVAASDFFVDLFETAIGEDEILTEVRIPKHTGWGAHYEKFVRIKHQWPIVAVAATVRVDGGTIAEARIGLTNMGSTPRCGPLRWSRRSSVPQATEDGVRDAAAQAAEGTDPPSDLNGDSDYRKHLATVLTRRAVLAAAGAWPDGAPATGSPSRPGVEETWAHFNDIEGVAGCFPGATVTEADAESFAGTVKVKLGPIALVYNGSGTFVEKDEAAHRLVIDAKGKDKRGNGTAGAMVTAVMTDAGERRDGRRGHHRPDHHRQGRAVRPRQRDQGRLRQAARPVRGLPRAAAERRPTPPTHPRGRSPPRLHPGGCHHRVPGTPRERGVRRPRAGGRAGGTRCRRRGRRRGARSRRHRRGRRRRPPARQPDDAIDLGATVLPVLVRAYWKPAAAVLVLLLVIIYLLVRD